MRHHDGPTAVALFHPFAYHFEDGMQGIVFADGAALRVVRVNPVKGQRFGLQIGALERFNMEMQRFIGHQPALLIHLQRNGGDLQQGVGFGIKSCGFNINHHWIKTAETVAQTIQLSVLGHQILLAGKK